MELVVRWQPNQRLAWNVWDDQKTTRAALGGARGGSKSGFLRRWLLLRRLKYPNTAGLLLRRTLPELQRSHLLKLFGEFPQLRAYYHEQKKMLALPNGSVQFFASAPGPKDVAKFYSDEFADIGIDEAQEFSQDEIERLSGSNRCTTNADILPKMGFSFMPGLSESGIPPVGLPYLKRVFIEKALRGEEIEHAWHFQQVFAWDNIEWARKPLTKDHVTDKQFYSWSQNKRRDYFLQRTVFGKQLRGLTNESLRDAWLYGKWDAFQGQYFPNFTYTRHTAPLAEIAARIHTWDQFWVSGDWGHDHPASFHLHCRDEHGHIFTVAEVWGREMGERKIGEAVGKMCRGENIGLKPGPLEIQAFPLSWDAFGRLNPFTKRAITTMIAEALPSNVPAPVPADASPGSRISGWRLMSEILDADGWTIARECTKLIECLPTLVRDMQRNSEDVLKVDYSENYVGDDPADDARYGLQWMRAAAEVPTEVQAERRIAQLEQELDQYGRPLSKTAIMMRLAFAERPKPPRAPWRIGGDRER